MSSGRSLFRRSAVALAAAGLALATVVAAVHPAELVLSQGQDTEAAQANVAASWPVAYAGNQAATVHFIKKGHLLGNDYASSHRWQLQNYGTSTTPPASPTSTQDVRTRQTSTVPSIVDSAAAQNDIAYDPYADEYHNWYGYPFGATNNTGRLRPDIQRCMFVAPNYSPATTAGPCGSQSGDIAAATNTQPGFGFSLNDGLTLGITYVNARDLHTAARCTPSGGIAQNSSFGGFIDVMLETGGTDPRPDYSTPSRVYRIWQGSDGASQPPLSDKKTIRSGLSYLSVRYRPIVKTITQTNPPYALSEIGFYLETVTTALGIDTEQSKAYFVLSKSECGVAPTGGASNLPPRSDDVGTSSASLARSTRVAADGMPDAAAAKRPESTTTTSPINDATGVEVTTSAPPDGGDGDEDKDGATAGSASSTSAGGGEDRTSDVIPEGGSETTGAAPTTAAPSEVPIVPDEPGQMPANAEFCESLEIDGEYVDAFTADECDAAARISAMSALEDYIADGEQDSRWKGFTSDDPEADGWRWAAIDQRTGQVVYVP